MTGIYKITSPSGKIYIGQSWDIDKRFKKYNNLYCKSQKKLYNSFIKYGVEKHTFEIIEVILTPIKQKELDEKEISYISFYKSKGYEMLNLTIGGKGTRGCIFTKETKEKMSLSRQGKKLSRETKNKMSEYSRNRTKEHKENNGKSRRKKIIQYSLTGEFIKEWDSLKDATSNNKGDIKACAKGIQQTAGGYIWEYSELKSDDIRLKIEETKIKSEQIETARRFKIKESFKLKRNIQL